MARPGQPSASIPEEVPRGPDILITSTGGLGTTTFIREMRHALLSAHLTVNHHADTDGLKHVPYGQLLQQNGTAARMRDVKKIIYLHGDLIHGVLSMARRGYLNIQARKIRTDKSHRRMGPTFPNLTEYAAEPNDYFQFEKHFEGFFEQCQYPIAFVDITKKTEHLGELADFLGASKSELEKWLSPWEASKISEKLAQKKVIREKRGHDEMREDFAGDPVSRGKVMREEEHKYSVSKEVMESLKSKLLPVEHRLQKLGGLYIRIPGVNCSKDVA